VAVAEAEAAEEADLVRDRLLKVDDEARLPAAAPRCGNVAAQSRGLIVAAHGRAIGEGQGLQDAVTASDVVPRLELDHRAEAAPEARLEIAVVGNLGLEKIAPAQGAMRPIPFDRDPVAVALGVGRIVPGARGPEAAIEEILAWIARIVVGVEKIGRREFAGGHGDARDIGLGRELVRSGRDRLLRAAEAESLAQEEPRDIDLRIVVAALLRLAIDETGDAFGPAQPEALVEFGVDIEFAAGPRQAAADEQGAGPGFAAAWCRIEAVRSAIGRVKPQIALLDEGGLRVEAPILRRERRIVAVRGRIGKDR